MEKEYIAFDMRAAGGDSSDASVLCAFASGETLKSVINETREMFGEGVIFSYDNPGDNNLINEKFETIVHSR